MYFQHFEEEIKLNIFKYVDCPLNLILTCRSWSTIASYKCAKVGWLLERYGKTHALFHAVRLGPTFIDIPICLTLFARKVTVSEYFIQGLLKHFGKLDQKLIELKTEYNGSQLDTVKIKPPWASNLSISVFTYLLNEGYKQLSNTNGDLKGSNDIELFSSIEIPQLGVPINNEGALNGTASVPIIDGISFYAN